MENSQEWNEFAVLPGATTQSNVFVDITRMGSHDSVRANAGGR